MIKTFGMVVFNTKGEVLLVEHGETAGHINGTYGLLVGHPEGEEAPIETAIREAEEEAGVLISPDELIELPKEYSADIPRSDGTTKSFSMRLFVKSGYEGKIRGANSETTPGFVSVDDLDNLTLLPNVKNAVLDAEQLVSI